MLQLMLDNLLQHNEMFIVLFNEIKEHMYERKEQHIIQLSAPIEFLL